MYAAHHMVGALIAALGALALWLATVPAGVGPGSAVLGGDWATSASTEAVALDLHWRPFDQQVRPFPGFDPGQRMAAPPPADWAPVPRDVVSFPPA